MVNVYVHANFHEIGFSQFLREGILLSWLSQTLTGPIIEDEFRLFDICDFSNESEKSNKAKNVDQSISARCGYILWQSYWLTEAKNQLSIL